MSTELKMKIGELAGKLIREAMESGLTWDESVAAIGLAAKALSTGATKEGDGTPESCQAHAKKRLDEAFAQDVQMVFAGADISQLQRAYEANPDSATALLANANWNIHPKMKH